MFQTTEMDMLWLGKRINKTISCEKWCREAHIYPMLEFLRGKRLR